MSKPQREVFSTDFKAKVPKQWVAEPKFLTFTSMRAPKFRHKMWVATKLSLRTKALKSCFANRFFFLTLLMRLMN